MTGITTATVLNQHISGHEANYQLLIPEQLIYFAGHFPDFPVLPGLVQIKWAVDFAKNISGHSHIKQINRLKFSGLILPNTTLSLTIHFDAEAGRANFRYHKNSGNNDRSITFSQGQLLYRD